MGRRTYLCLQFGTRYSVPHGSLFELPDAIPPTLGRPYSLSRTLYNRHTPLATQDFPRSIFSQAPATMRLLNSVPALFLLCASLVHAAPVSPHRPLLRQHA